MNRWLAPLGGVACGLLALAVLPSLIGDRALQPPAPAVEPHAPMRPVPRAAPFATEVETEEEVDPLREYLVTEASRLPGEFLARDDLDPIAREWRRPDATETSFLLEGLDERRWITQTAVRVDCERVDRMLHSYDDAEIGRPDRCARWLEKAAETMARFGISDRGPEQFMRDIGVEPTMRVMLVYAGWTRDSATDDAIRLVAAEPVLVYPQRGFPERDYAARDAVYRAMKLGPHAEDRAPE